MVLVSNSRTGTELGLLRPKWCLIWLVHVVQVVEIHVGQLVVQLGYFRWGQTPRVLQQVGLLEQLQFGGLAERGIFGLGWLWFINTKVVSHFNWVV